MHIISITVRGKVAVNPAQDRYVCGNSDYVVRFDFDAEWDAYETKTARFIKEDGTVYDQVFTGSDCPVPVIADTYKLMVGAYAGNLSTTTAAYVPCKKSILCGGGVPAAPAEDVYSQIMARLNAFAPEATDPHTQLVTDAQGKAVWEEKLAYKAQSTGTLLAETTLAAGDERPITTPWERAPVAGTVCTVTYNGTAYECLGVDMSALIGAPDGAVVAFGKLSNIGLEGGNDNAPFMLASYAALETAQAQGLYGMLMADNMTDPITISVAGPYETLKKLDEDFLPYRSPIVLTVDEDGNVTSDTGFAEAWALSAAQLRALVVIREQKGVYVTHEYTVDNVVKREQTQDTAKAQIIQMRVLGSYMDDTTPLYDPVRYLHWTNLNVETPLGFDDSITFRGLPHFMGNGGDCLGTYLRYKDQNGWEAVSIEQLKADLGLT